LYYSSPGIIGGGGSGSSPSLGSAKSVELRDKRNKVERSTSRNFLNKLISPPFFTQRSNFYAILDYKKISEIIASLMVAKKGVSLIRRESIKKKGAKMPLLKIKFFKLL